MLRSRLMLRAPDMPLYRCTGRSVTTVSVLAGIAACTRFVDLTSSAPPVPPDVSATDGSAVDSSARVDATGIDAAPCQFGPFGAPSPITAANSPDNDFGPSLSGDGLALFFGSHRPGRGLQDIWVSTRADPGDAFGPARPIDPVNTSDNDNDPAISADGLTLYFDSDRSGSQRIYVARRTSPDDAFGPPVELRVAPNFSDVYGADISGDQLTLMLTANHPSGQGDDDLWIMTRPSRADDFGDPLNLSATNSAASDAWPSLSSDATRVFFDSDRGGQSRDLMMATRITAAAPFGPAQPLGSAVNSPVRDGDPDISSDGRTLIFTSTRPGGQGQADLWMSIRQCL